MNKNNPTDYVKETTEAVILLRGEPKNSLLEEMKIAEAKAWDAISRYKFWMFGYWAAIWVHLNRIAKLHRPNPWVELVKIAKRRGAR
jgi:hypothetical protein